MSIDEIKEDKLVSMAHALADDRTYEKLSDRFTFDLAMHRPKNISLPKLKFMEQE